MTDVLGDRMPGVGPGGAWTTVGGELEGDVPGAGELEGGVPGAGELEGDVPGAGEPGGEGPERAEPGAEAGMTTVEYTVGTIAAASFAILLLNIIRSRQVLQWIVDILHAALSVPSRL